MSFSYSKHIISLIHSLQIMFKNIVIKNDKRFTEKDCYQADRKRKRVRVGGDGGVVNAPILWQEREGVIGCLAIFTTVNISLYETHLLGIL